MIIDPRLQRGFTALAPEPWKSEIQLQNLIMLETIEMRGIRH